MSFESQPGNSVEKEKSFDRKFIEARNGIQMAIMSLSCSPDEGFECFDRWRTKNGANFEKIFKRLVETDISILDDWERNRDFYTDKFMEELREMPEESEERRAA